VLEVAQIGQTIVHGGLPCFEFSCSATERRIYGRAAQRRFHLKSCRVLT
jgi:hypothetical protein